MGTESLGLYPHEPYIAYLSRLGWLWSTSQWPTSRNLVAFHALDLLHLPNDWDLERWPPTTSYRSGWKTSHDWKGDFVPQFRPQLPMMTSDLPLSGKRVLELGQAIAGPFCGRIPHAIPLSGREYSASTSLQAWFFMVPTFACLGRNLLGMDLLWPRGPQIPCTHQPLVDIHHTHSHGPRAGSSWSLTVEVGRSLFAWRGIVNHSISSYFDSNELIVWLFKPRWRIHGSTHPRESHK